MIFFHFRCPAGWSPCHYPKRKLPTKVANVKIEISHAFSQRFLVMSSPVGLYRYPSCFFLSQKFFSPFSPRQAAGELLSRVKLPEVTRGGKTPTNGEVPGWVGLENWGGFFLAPSRSRFLLLFFFKCVCLGVVVNVSCEDAFFLDTSRWVMISLCLFWLDFFDVSYITVLQVRLFRICSMFLEESSKEGSLLVIFLPRFLLVILLPSCLKETIHLF